MSAGKTLTAYKLLAKVESAYATFPSMTDAADAIQVAELPVFDTQYGFDGERPDPPGTGGRQIGLPPQGAFYNPTFKIEDKGGGSAYSASVVPRDTHVLLRAAGFDAAVTTTGGAEKWTYTPTPVTSSPTSCGFEAYGSCIPGGNVEKWSAKGVYTDFVYEVANGQQAFFTFTAWGVQQAAPSEVAWATPTYAPTIVPPVAAPLVLTVNAVTSLVVRSAKVTLGRTIQSRFPDHDISGLHPGFHPARRVPELSFVVEAPTFSALNLHSLWSAGTGIAASFQVGATQYNRRKWTFAQTQLKSVKRQADGAIPLLEVTCRLYNSTPSANDDISIVDD